LCAFREMIASNAGLGFLLQQVAENYEIARALAVAIEILLVASAITGLVGWLARRGAAVPNKVLRPSLAGQSRARGIALALLLFAALLLGVGLFGWLVNSTTG